MFLLAVIDDFFCLFFLQPAVLDNLLTSMKFVLHGMGVLRINLANSRNKVCIHFRPFHTNLTSFLFVLCVYCTASISPLDGGTSTLTNRKSIWVACNKQDGQQIFGNLSTGQLMTFISDSCILFMSTSLLINKV